MRAALDLLAETPGRHLALLGDMRELGPASAAEHRAIGQAAAEVLDALFTIGDESRVLSDAARASGCPLVEHVADVEAAIERLLDLLQPGDAVLVKGSHALGLERVAAAVEARWNGDRE